MATCDKVHFGRCEDNHAPDDKTDRAPMSTTVPKALTAAECREIEAELRRVIVLERSRMDTLTAEYREEALQFRAERDAAIARAERAEGEIARKDAALREYGQHFDSCDSTWEYSNDPCNCGFDAALALTPIRDSRTENAHPAPAQVETFNLQAPDVERIAEKVWRAAIESERSDVEPEQDWLHEGCSPDSGCPLYVTIYGALRDALKGDA